MTGAPHFNVNGCGFKGGKVAAVEAGLVGYWSDDKPWRPDAAAVRTLLPYRWRKAFDRAGPFWFPDDKPTQCYVRLDALDGRNLTTVYANGSESEQ